MYLVNKLDHNLSLKNGYLTLKVGMCVPIKEADLVEPSIADAISRRWAETSEVEVIPTEAVSVKVTSTNPYEGLTEDQMKAELAARAEKPAATTTRLGVPDTDEKKEGTSEAIGQPAAEVVEATVEATVEAPAVTPKKPGKTSK